MDLKLIELANEYVKAKIDYELAISKKEALSVQLKEAMTVAGQESIKLDNALVKIQNRSIITFDDAIIQYLKTNQLDTYIIETVDQTGLKKALVKSPILAQQLEQYTKLRNLQSLIVIKQLEA
jgi:hypothetical protein